MRFVLDVSIVDILFTPLPPEASMQSAELAIDVGSPVAGPSTALDTIISVLKNEDNRYQAEIRLNTCNLLTQVAKGREAKIGAISEREMERLKDNLKVVLSATASSSESLALSTAAQSALEAPRLMLFPNTQFTMNLKKTTSTRRKTV